MLRPLVLPVVEPAKLLVSGADANDGAAAEHNVPIVVHVDGLGQERGQTPNGVGALAPADIDLTSGGCEFDCLCVVGLAAVGSVVKAKICELIRG